MSDGAGSLNTDVGGRGFSVLKKTAQLFSKVAAPFYIPTSSIWMIRFSASASAFGVVTIYKFWRECSGFNLHFPDGWRYCFFSWTYLAVYESSLVKCLFMSFAHFLIELFGFSVLRVFYVFDVLVLCWTCNCKVFPPSLSIHPLDSIFGWAEV